MAEHDLEQLLGGFAADQLTPDEKQRLYSAALQDQQLFDALADEQALKELLADPAVRRRLLASLEQKSASGAGRPLFWLDWFWRPANLAWAGGLATVIFAIVLGMKIYQDSLRPAATSLATEEAKPATPPNSPPPASQPAPPPAEELTSRAKERAEFQTSPAKRDALSDKLAKQELPTKVLSKEPQAVDAGRQSPTASNEQDRVRSQAEAPMAMRGKAAEEVATVADEKIAATTPPPAGSAPAPVQSPATALMAGAGTPTVSARALFYGGRPEPAAPEQKQAAKSLAESAPQANRFERKLEGNSPLSNAAGASATPTTLGLRYSFVVRGNNGQDQEVDAATVLRSKEPVRLTVETNQAAYLQVWMMGGTTATQLLFPTKGSGQISARVAAGQRQSIPLPEENGAITLVLRLSLVPFGPISRQEAAMLDRPGAGQLQEVVATPGPTGRAEYATYVVNNDPSTPIQAVLDLAPRR